jgi:acetolactate synthase I/II/III large subunit
VIHVGHTSATVEQVFFPHAEVVGDMGASLLMLAERLAGKLSRAPALLALRQEILQRVADRATEDRYPLTPQRIVHDVRAVMPEHGIVTLDNGMYKIWFARNYRTRVANTLLLDNALAAMGAGLPSAIMATLLHSERRVLAICGDGGFMMNSQETETAVRLGANLVVLILEDSAYGMIRWKQAVEGFADWGMTFGNPDFIRYAEAYGGTGHRVEAADDLIPALEAAFQARGVHLVAVPDRVLREHARAGARVEGQPAGHRADVTCISWFLTQAGARTSGVQLGCVQYGTSGGRGHGSCRR